MRRTSAILLLIKKISTEIREFFSYVVFYLRKKIVSFSHRFEKNKNMLVKFFLMKRGRYNRPFLHFTTMGVIGFGVLIAPFLADTYPIFSSKASALDFSASDTQKQSVSEGEEVFNTARTNVRDKIITYNVQKGDTLATIADKFQISQNTIKWANDLTSDDLTTDQSLKILPVTGIAYKVQSGDTIESIAKKFNTDPEKIAEYPFNEFANPESLTLVTGQMLTVPDGIEPSEQQYIKPEVSVAQGPVPVATGGFTYPIHGLITQFFSWYHPGLDIAAPYGTPIVAAHSGTVTRVSVGTYDTGYGNNVWLSNGAGMESHYAHMSAVNVSVGQQVIGGQTVVGWIGLTGRTTGPHVHFEMRRNGTYVNPLSYVQ